MNVCEEILPEVEKSLGVDNMEWKDRKLRQFNREINYIIILPVLLVKIYSVCHLRDFI